VVLFTFIASLISFPASSFAAVTSLPMGCVVSGNNGGTHALYYISGCQMFDCFALKKKSNLTELSGWVVGSVVILVYGSGSQTFSVTPHFGGRKMFMPQHNVFYWVLYTPLPTQLHSLRTTGLQEVL